MIKVGDLMMVVKPMPCCGKSGILGIPFIVKNIYIPTKPYCVHCNSDIPIEPSTKLNSGNSVALYRLIKIDPPALQDETTTEKELAL